MSIILGVSREVAEEIKKKVKKFQESADKVLEPGEKYIFKGTLSLTMKVYVMNENIQFDSKVCWTGPTDGSENTYTISKDFSNLDIKKQTVTVYSK